ncbi:MAG: GntR family transcriptional regulator [Rubrimonas sp.]|uniref:GntR family transcriptional regulator n=1 Tax=Rubrimonas sp. TaxID=2036015 RepID=UPI002FDDE885
MSAPKYKRIEQALVARIAAGEFAPGDPIPHEAQLAEAYGVTRPTIGRALSALVAQGLIERRRRAGSRVALRARVAARLSIPLAREEIEAGGAAYGYRLLGAARRAAPADVAALFGLAAGAEALETDALHLADGAAWQRERRWINLAVVPAAADAPFETVSPNEWLVRHAPYTRIAHRVWADAATPDDAPLGAAPGDPLLCVERRTWLGARAVTLVRMLHRGPGYKLTFDDDA